MLRGFRAEDLAFLNPVLFVVDKELGAALVGQRTPPLLGLLPGVVYG